MRSFKTIRRGRQRLMIFARYPELGRVKSRLATSVGDPAALELYRAMVEDLLDGIGRSDEQTEIEIVWTGGENVPGREVTAFFRDYPLTTQSGMTLGDRLAVAFSERVIFHDVTKVIAIGTDDPALSRGEVDRAFALLDSCDWTIGPAHDGGYYLIGARSDAYRNAIFRDIDWGTSSVFESTLTAVRRLRASVAVLPRRFDIDHEADLRAFVQSGRVTPHLLAAAERLEIGK